MPPTEPSHTTSPRAEPSAAAPVSASGQTSLVQGQVPPILSGAPNLVGLLRALRHRWLLATVVATCGAVLTLVAITTLVQAPYTASTRLHFDRRPPTYLVAEQGGDMTSLYRSQIPAFHSKEVLSHPAVLELPFLPSDPGERAAYLEKTVVAEIPANQEVLRISAAGEDPKEMADLVNAVVKAYLHSLRKKAEAHGSNLQTDYKSAADRLEIVRKNLATRDPAKVAELERQIQAVRLDRRKAEAALSVQQESESQIATVSVPESYVSESLDADSAYVALERRHAQLDQEIRLIADRSALGENDPQIAGKIRQRRQLRQEIDDYRAKARPAIQKEYRDDLRQEHQHEVARLQAQLRSLDSVNTVLERDLGVAGGREESSEYRRWLTELPILENTVKRLGNEQDTFRTSAKDPTSWVQVLGDAAPPAARTRDKQFKLGGVATGAVFFGLLGLVAFMEFRSRRLQSTDDVVQGLGLPLVGTIPALPAQVRASPVAVNPKHAYWQGQLTEAIDALRTYLIRTAGDQPCVVMVTSAVAGEGKTSLASQLAASLARAWRKTLLVDGDLRNPALHQLFELPQEPGFSEVLRGELEVPEVIRPTPLSRLWLMPAGHWDAHALQSLAQEGVENLFIEFKEEYDFIVVDSSPVLPVADTLLLSQQSDTVLFSALRGTTRLTTLYAAQQRLAAIDVPILGVVVTGARGTLGGLDIQYPRPSAT